jgi:hypothetical protein
MGVCCVCVCVCVYVGIVAVETNRRCCLFTLFVASRINSFARVATDGDLYYWGAKKSNFTEYLNSITRHPFQS